jgi:hypothetical protein
MKINISTIVIIIISVLIGSAIIDNAIKGNDALFGLLAYGFVGTLCLAFADNIKKWLGIKE